jgi:hypothetical protein
MTADELYQRLMGAAIRAVQEAGKELADCFLNDLNEGCDGEHHAPVGAPPRRESGIGRGSVGYRLTATGIDVGVSPITEKPEGRKTMPNLGGMPGENYLAGHDTGKGVSGGQPRPWMSNWKERHKANIDIRIDYELCSEVDFQVQATP